MTAYKQAKQKLLAEPKHWLVTGVAGFIGSNLLEALLRLNQSVVGLDNFSTGKRRNLEEVRISVAPEQWERFNFIEGDICRLETCQLACQGVDSVLHHAALGSVPRSLADPITSNASNVTGFLNMLVAARDQKIKRFVYASSSSVYGDHPGLPKREERIGQPLSPYAVTKSVGELYASVFARCYGLETIGLRYFNVFGPRQDPEGSYAAVIPRWIAALIHDKPVCINGDGETSRDFCFVENVVQANLLAATTTNPEAGKAVYNIALNRRTSLNDLFYLLRERLEPDYPYLRGRMPLYRDFRAGDIAHSQADITLAQRLLRYHPTHQLAQGLDAALGWYMSRFSAQPITRCTINTRGERAESQESDLYRRGSH